MLKGLLFLLFCCFDLLLQDFLLEDEVIFSAVGFAFLSF